MPTAALIDHQDVKLPVLPTGRFWFLGPDLGNLDP
jgi:hypothetical protein